MSVSPAANAQDPEIDAGRVAVGSVAGTSR